MDGVAERLALAQELGAQPLPLGSAAAGGGGESGGGSTAAVAASVHAGTDGRGADVVLEAVGSPAALRLAYELVRPMGTISSVGVHTGRDFFPFSPVEAYNKNLSVRCGRCPARAYMGRLLPLVASRRYDFCRIVTHRLPLSSGVAAYHMFEQRAQGCIKVMLDPCA